jgi:hypothetical protein
MPAKLFLTSLLLGLVILFPAFNSHAQKAPIKFGHPDRADLEMTLYEPDTSAVAVVLCDYGIFSKISMDFTRTFRIKILKPEGAIWGDMVFPTAYKMDVRGITYNLENGEIVESKLKFESIYVEKITDESYRTRVAMPNVRVGSVIDIEFTTPWLPSVWKFQQRIPVRWSELIIDYTPMIDYRMNYFGMVPLDESSRTRWLAKDVPAFKLEPFMSDEENYMAKYEIEVLNISIPATERYHSFYREYSTTWDVVSDRLLQNTYFGLAMIGCTFLNDAAKDIEKLYPTSKERMIAAYEWIKSHVDWDEREALFISGDNLADAFNEKIGNSADINLMLIQMLKKLDLDVYPVALSTRENGFLSPLYPSLSKLNYVVALVKIDDKSYLLDATDQYLPAGILPERCINLQGRIIDEVAGDWVDLTPEKKFKQTVQYDLVLDQELGITGSMTRTNYDYAAHDFREDFAGFNSEEEYLVNLEQDHQGLFIHDFSLQNLDSIYLPVTENYEVKLNRQVTRIGEMVYINPLFDQKWEENPFKSEERYYPVDFIYQRDLTIAVKMALPDGIGVVELPKATVMKLPDKSASIVYQVNQMGNMLHLTYKFNISRQYYGVDEYPDLRAFFAEVVKKHAEPIVLKYM